jgi:hypothetical protein
MSNKQGILHLVHGTFARDAEWIHPDSPLAQTISHSLGDNVHIEPFNWSGDNSHTARETAGIALADKIRNCNRGNPGLPQYIVAHSHGGNVAAYALSDSDTRANVSGVACLGTPFIKARTRDLAGSRHLMQSILAASMLMVLLLMVGIVSQGLDIFVDRQKYERQVNAMSEDMKELKEEYEFFKDLNLKKDEEFYKIPGAQWYFTGFFMLFAIGIGWLMIKPIIKLWRFVLQKELPRIGERQSALTASLTAVFNSTPLLVVNAKGDEAAWWLTTVNRIASFPYRIWKPTNFTLVGIAVISILIIVPLSFYSETSFGMTQMLIFMALLIFSLSTLLVYTAGWALCLIWPAIFRSHALGFGKDDFLQNFVVEITSTEAPENTTQISKHTVTVHGKGLHHSRLYQEEHVLELISDWFKNLQQQQNDPPVDHGTTRNKTT